MIKLRRLSIHVPASEGAARDPTNSSLVPAPRHPELSRLPKAPAIRSIRFKRTNPGSVSHLCFGPETTPVIDPLHPLAHLRPHQLMRIVPHYHCSLFGIHAYPQAVLRKFEVPKQMIHMKDREISNELGKLIANFLDPGQSDWSQGSTMFTEPIRVGDRRRAAHTLPMSLMIVTPKRPLHKSGVIRNKIKLRLKEALNLVAIRGASPHGECKKSITLSTPEGLHGENMKAYSILLGWTYVIRPSLQAYRCPWPSLLQHLRDALLSIQSHATKLEAKWAQSRRREQRGIKSRDALSQQNASNRQRSYANSSAKQIRTNQSPKTFPVSK